MRIFVDERKKQVGRKTHKRNKHNGEKVLPTILFIITVLSDFYSIISCLLLLPEAVSFTVSESGDAGGKGESKNLLAKGHPRSFVNSLKL